MSRLETLQLKFGSFSKLEKTKHEAIKQRNDQLYNYFVLKINVVQKKSINDSC